MLVGLLLLFSLLLVLDGFRLRGRVVSWNKIPEENRPGTEPFTFLSAPGVALPPEDIRRVQRWMELEKVQAVDVIPGDMDGIQAMNLAMFYDPETYRSMPFSRGRSALHGVMMRKDLAEKVGIESGTAANPAVLARAAYELKRYAPRSTTLAVLNTLKGQGEALAWRRQVMCEAFGGEATTLFYGAPFFYLLLIAGLFHPLGWLVLLCYHLQLSIVFLGQELRIRNLMTLTCFRLPIEMVRWWGSFSTMKRAVSSRQEKIEELRPVYQEKLRKSSDVYFEPKRKRCTLCKGESLSNLIDTPDLYQGKPGRFRLDECEHCGHIFQNPQLSIEGLSFYYRDFYDGLGEDLLESIFDSAGNPYGARGDFTLRYMEKSPGKWLDVGAGHGHFCLWMKGICKETRFEALDLGDSIQGALDREWVDEAHQGLFTELASTLENTFEVVSMSHYLEHTPTPLAELDAAATVLVRDGILFIELPDPECKLGRILGRYWLPWFQPQHLNFFSVANLSAQLEKRGFEVAGVERGPAHQSVDLSSAWMLWLNRFFPDRNVPWHPPYKPLEEGTRKTVWAFGLIPLALLKGIDVLLRPFLARKGWSNTFRLAARLTHQNEVE